MYVITARNVSEAWVRGAELMRKIGVRAESRNGPVLVAPTPVMTVYAWPCERVLLDPVRDANPFFHFFESLWMLAGRDDTAFLNQFVKDFGARFAEEDGRLHGAYGLRWRGGFGFDQLEVVIDKLRKNPDDRQAVIQMWSADTMDMGFNDLCGNWKDRPCNTHVYLRVRQNARYRDMDEASWDCATGAVLDLTVCCRSNDIVWGAYGANAVHFSVLQEYLAGRIGGVQVGKMYQLSNNWHAYVDVFDKLSGGTQLGWPTAPKHPVPIGTKWDDWDADLEVFMDWAARLDHGALPTPANKWFETVAWRMFRTHLYVRAKDWECAEHMARMIEDASWSQAAVDWIARRRK